MTTIRLAARELWRDDGHLSDLVLTALADGQDALVPQQASEHVATCATCSERLGALALRSVQVGEALAAEAAAAPQGPSPHRSYRLPALALAAAFVLALLGSLPRLLELVSAFGEAPGSGVETVLIVLKGAALLFRTANQQDTPAVALAWCAAGLALLALGALVVRLAPPGTLERNRHASSDS